MTGSPIQQPGMHIVNTIEHIDQLFELQGSEFISATYRTLLSRDPDQIGALYYLGRLRAGFSKRSVVAQIAESSEAILRKAKVAGLDKLIREEKLAKHWMWGLFKRSKSKEIQLNQLELVLGSLEKGLVARIGSLENKLDEINIQSKAWTFSNIENHQSKFVSQTTYSAKSTPRSSIIHGFKIPAECSASVLIAEIENQVVLSAEAAAFKTCNSDHKCETKS